MIAGTRIRRTWVTITVLLRTRAILSQTDEMWSWRSLGSAGAPGSRAVVDVAAWSKPGDRVGRGHLHGRNVWRARFLRDWNKWCLMRQYSELS